MRGTPPGRPSCSQYGPMMCKVWPAAACGAGGRSRTPHRPHQRRHVKARLPQGRLWTAIVEPNQPFAVLQVQLAAIMRKPVEAFVMQTNGETVNQNDIIPDELEEIELKRVRPETPVQRQRSRSRSPRPAVQRLRPQQAHAEIRNMDKLHLEFPAANGTYLIVIHLDDIESADDWRDVTAGDLEQTLIKVFPSLFGIYNRVTLAVNLRILRPEEHIGDFHHQEAHFTMVPAPRQGGRPKMRSPLRPHNNECSAELLEGQQV